MTDAPCPPSFRKEFLGEPKCVELAPGERLYKFVNIPLDRNRILASPWWIRQSAFDVLRLRAERLKQPLREVARAHLAINVDWNPGMDMLWGIVLATTAIGWEGRARSQSVKGRDSQAAFIGGGMQLCVPGLEWQQIAMDFAAHYTR